MRNSVEEKKPEKPEEKKERTLEAKNVAKVNEDKISNHLHVPTKVEDKKASQSNNSSNASAKVNTTQKK